MLSARAALLAGLGLIAGPVSAGSSEMTLEVGQPFPDLVLPSLADGEPASLADFRGRKLVLHVFASW